MDEQQFLIDNEINRCYIELKKLENTPRRTQKFSHKEDISRLEGRIEGLKTKLKMSGPFCPHCKSQQTDGLHYGVVFVNGYPAPCPNNGRLFFDSYATVV